jgi:hypothetical protein
MWTEIRDLSGESRCCFDGVGDNKNLGYVTLCKHKAYKECGDESAVCQSDGNWTTTLNVVLGEVLSI